MMIDVTRTGEQPKTDMAHNERGMNKIQKIHALFREKRHATKINLNACSQQAQDTKWEATDAISLSRPHIHLHTVQHICRSFRKLNLH